MIGHKTETDKTTHKLINPDLLQNMRISRKISFVHSILFLILQIVLGSILLFAIRMYYPLEATGELNTLSGEICENVISYHHPITNSSLTQLIPTVSQKYATYIRITDSEGNTLVSYGDMNHLPTLDSPFHTVIKSNTKDAHLIYMNCLQQTGTDQEVIVQIVFDITQNLQFNTVIFKLLLLLTVFGFFISIFTGSLVGHVVLQPITNIIHTAKGISADNLGVRIKTGNTEDEIYELSQTINDMIARLEASFVEQKQLVADVSHELKTPISVMKGYVSLLERWGTENPEVLQESLSRLSAEIENMSAIVEDLLFLARKDNGTLSLEQTNFDVSKLIDEIVADTKTIDATCDITIMRNDSCSYLGDYRLLKQMLRIIIDNCMKYSEKQCVIEIWSTKKEDCLCVKIKDCGIGISPCDLERIFNRFYRADKARTRNQGGSGLGLAIAKEIVDSHNGEIKAESKLGVGTSILITLPI